MMLCHGGLILLKSPSQNVVILESETEKPCKDLETRAGHRRRELRSQLLESKFDTSRSERVSKPTRLRLDANSGTFKGKHLGTDKVELKAPEPNSATKSDYKQDKLPKNGKETLLSDTSRKQEIFRSSNSERFCKKPSSYAPDSSGDDWKSLSRALASGQKVSAISNHDLMRIAELRFSTDMNEGDGGSTVVLLQKALFWLGHLSKQSDITGYFGTETKQALCEFQEAHGVGQTGVWGPLSKQALWHIVSAEILHRAVDEKSSRSAKVKNFDSRSKSDIFTQVCQSWTPMKLADVFKTALPEGDWRLLSGIALLIAGVLLGLLISKVSSPPLQSNLVGKRRIVRSPELEKRNSLTRDEEEVTNSSSSNGATIVNNISELTSKKPSYITEADATGQADALGVQEKKLFLGARYISSLGHGVQNGSPKPYGTSKKDAYASPVLAQKASGSKVGAESTRGKQTGSWSRPIRQNMREDNKPPPLSSNARGTIGMPRKNNESMLPLSTSKSSSIGQKDELPGPSKRFGNDFGLLKDDGAAMQGEDEPNVRKRIEELRKAVEAAEQNGQAAVLALAEERKRSQELGEKISKQRESAAALEEEVRVLKESHDALLESLRKKIGSATRGASLLYQNFKDDGGNGVS